MTFTACTTLFILIDRHMNPELLNNQEGHIKSDKSVML